MNILYIENWSKNSHMKRKKNYFLDETMSEFFKLILNAVSLNVLNTEKTKQCNFLNIVLKGFLIRFPKTLRIWILEWQINLNLYTRYISSLRKNSSMINIQKFPKQWKDAEMFSDIEEAFTKM